MQYVILYIHINKYIYIHVYTCIYIYIYMYIIYICIIYKDTCVYMPQCSSHPLLMLIMEVITSKD